ncbi:succinate dehydrogenase/fumarate reductase flavoprotein subunit [Azospirillum agricola]|uniref:FAD-dependent oxidoreductase n=1 Tax=Azospirillum agricola TaxID=1720247 RepID=UPI001AE6F760|nr:FAD-dependent oxidoreductase [Azospirillum agricola]MBP2228748.1 succinate dehydrogenase/fumarate reductase flavoprotein subunit [Azospirillum agricola]
MTDRVQGTSGAAGAGAGAGAAPGTAPVCDVLVVGSGAGGLSVAVTAAWHGLDVLVAEKAPKLGGTTAWSGGWLWIPRNPLAEAAGIREDVEEPRRYLRAILGNRYDAGRIDAFLENGPRMVSFFEENTAVRFVAGNAVPDFDGDAPGAATGGRSVCGAPYDGRELGEAVALLRRPPAEMTLMGMGIASGADLWHFLNARRSLRSALHAGRRLARHAVDLVRHGRAMQLVNGEALAGRLLKSALDLKVRFRTGSPVVRLIVEEGAVRGAVLRTPDGDVAVRARRGVVLAAGGFPHDPERRRELFGHAPTGAEHWSAAPPDNSGDGLRLGESAGAEVDRGLRDAGAWAPVSRLVQRDGSVLHFPHLIDRGKPGLIAVTAAGRRFANEANSYHAFMRDLLAAVGPGEEAAAWLVCDHRFQRRYGLGASKPFPVPLGRYRRNGYLVSAPTLEELARRCGIDPAGLAATVEAFNRDARAGRDPAFGRGGTPYNRVSGDPGHGPNPTLGPIERGPFHAVRILPGSLGTFAGLKTDAAARVLGRDGRPIAGLYATGNDMASVMGGHYPSGGITLGPAMTFGYLAGLDLARKAAG